MQCVGGQNGYRATFTPDRHRLASNGGGWRVHDRLVRQIWSDSMQISAGVPRVGPCAYVAGLDSGYVFREMKIFRRHIGCF